MHIFKELINLCIGEGVIVLLCYVYKYSYLFLRHSIIVLPIHTNLLL